MYVCMYVWTVSSALTLYVCMGDQIPGGRGDAPCPQPNYLMRPSLPVALAFVTFPY